jgi:hypothetical protein
VSEMAPRSGALARAMLWAALASLVGSNIASVFAFGVLVVVDRSAQHSQLVGGAFQVAAVVFLIAIAICGAGFIPLVLVIMAFIRLGPRFPRFEESWGAVAIGSTSLGVVYAVGFMLAIAPFVGSWHWYDYVSTPLAIGFGASAGLFVARWLHPDLGPGALCATMPRVRLGLRTAASILVSSTLLAFATVVVETSMELNCVSGDSCTEVVAVRGLPYPFIQRSFVPEAFAYDVMVFSLVSGVVLRLRHHLRARRSRPAEIGDAA